MLCSDLDLSRSDTSSTKLQAFNYRCFAIWLRIDARYPKHISTLTKTISGIIFWCSLTSTFCTDSQIERQQGTLQKAPHQANPAPRKLQPFKNECSPLFFLPALLFIGLRIDARCPKHISKQPNPTFQLNHQAGTLQGAQRQENREKTFNTSCCAPILIYSTLIQAPRKLQALNNKCSTIFSSQSCITILFFRWLSFCPFSGIFFPYQIF